VCTHLAQLFLYFSFCRPPPLHLSIDHAEILEEFPPLPSGDLVNIESNRQHAVVKAQHIEAASPLLILEPKVECPGLL
jgi:hypothetical protein